MIKKVQMKNCSPYNEEGAELNECKKVNYIYGANGSGKSTISEFLSKYNEENERYICSSIEWDSMNKASIMVYNREFKKNNLYQENGLPGIFTLGSATIEDIKELEKLKIDLENKKEEYRKKYKTLERKLQEKNEKDELFKENAWKYILKHNERDFKSAFKGLRNNKQKFINELLVRFNKGKGKMCSRDELISRAETLYVSKPEKCYCLNIDNEKYNIEIETIRNDSIWSMVISGNESVDIGKLIKHLENAAWIEQGRKYISEDTNICPFCQKETIDESFRKQLERFFDTEYEEKLEYIEQRYKIYVGCSEQITNGYIQLLDNEDLFTVGKLDRDLYSARVKTLIACLDKNENRICSKYREPGIKVELLDASNIVNEIDEMLHQANEKIKAHNRLVEKFDEETKILTDDIWKTCICEEEVLIKGYLQEDERIKRAITGLEGFCNDLKEKIKKEEKIIIDKGKNITSVEPAVNEINRLLKGYGFTNFSIQPAKAYSNMYEIVREDGTSAISTLSEGEETFLTFLYFMQLTKGAMDVEKVSDKKIIVLDDPICSLDSTILYIVANMVKELSKSIRDGVGDVEQLFVLTHNVFFHKEVSQIDGRTKKVGDINYWIIRKDEGVSRIQAYGMENPISTSYELLWKELRDNNNISIISLQNTMRRIIENYFGMLGNRKNDHIINGFSTPEEKTICYSLLAWINDGSHSIPDDLYIDSYSDALLRYKNVFRDIFRNSGNEAHYNMMMGIEVD